MRIRRAALLLALGLLFLALSSPAAGAQSSAEPYNERVRTVEQAIGAAIGHDTAGAAFILFEAGARTSLEGFGYADITALSPVFADTAFEIGELSALFVAVAALRLSSEGKLDIDADVATVLPADFFRKLHLTRITTTRDLLTGNAGFSARTLDTAFAKSRYRFDTLPDALLADVPPQTLPDTVRLCVPSAFGVTLAAYVVECAAGMPYEEYVQTAVFAPLGMKNTVLAPTEENVTAVGYTVSKDGEFTAAANGGRTYSVLYPADGAISTAGDLSLLVAWLLSSAKNDPVMPLSYKSILFEVYTVAGVFQNAAMVFGARDTARGVEGGTAGFHAAIWLDTVSKNAAVVLTNTKGSPLTDLPRTLCAPEAPRAVLPTDETETAPALREFRAAYTDAATEMRTFAGKVASMRTTVRVTVNKEDETLCIGDRRFVRLSAETFADVNAPDVPALRFLLDARGRITALVTDEGTVYLPVKWYQQYLVCAPLLAAVLICAAWFLLSGIFAVLRAASERGDPDRRGVGMLLPPLFSMALAFFALLPALLGLRHGTALISSFYTACSVITLFLSIAAIAVYLVAFWATVFDRSEHRRLVHNATALALFVALLFYWRLAYS